MAELKAYIQWEITNDNGDVVRSSYEHISDIDDAQNWVDHMSECLEEADGEESEDNEDDDDEYYDSIIKNENISVSFKNDDYDELTEYLRKRGYIVTYTGKHGETWTLQNE
jgi:hypothetical protein